MKIKSYVNHEKARNFTKRVSLSFFATAFSLFLVGNSQMVCADGAFVLGATSRAETIEDIDTLVFKDVSVPAGTDAPGAVWSCAVTCRAEVTDAGDPGFGTLSLLDNGIVVPGSTQSFEMDNLSPMPVSTTAVTTIVKAAQPERLSCALQEVGATDLFVNDTSMSIVCTDLP